MEGGRCTLRRMGTCRKEDKERSVRALQGKRAAKTFLQSLTHAPPKKSHLLRKPHLTTLMEEVPSNEESCKSFSKMNRENTKYV